MTKIKTAAVLTLLLALCACQSVGTKQLEDAGVTATDCFSAGGTIDSSSGASLCQMQDGTTKPIL